MGRSQQIILAELTRVFSAGELLGQARFVDEVAEAPKIVCIGAGRVGLAMAGFAKRLSHLGKDAFNYNDITLPALGPGDLAVFGSGSGETESIVCLAHIAKSLGLRLALVTSAPRSRLASLSDSIVVLDCANKLDPTAAGGSVQPMTSLFEQASQVFLDGAVLDLMSVLGVSEDDMRRRHNAIE